MNGKFFFSSHSPIAGEILRKPMSETAGCWIIRVTEQSEFRPPEKQHSIVHIQHFDYMVEYPE